MDQQGHSRMSGMGEKVKGQLEKVGGALLCNKDLRERGRAHELEGAAEIHMAKAESAAQHGHSRKAVHEEQRANEKLAKIPGAHVVTSAQEHDAAAAAAAGGGARPGLTTDAYSPGGTIASDVYGGGYGMPGGGSTAAGVGTGVGGELASEQGQYGHAGRVMDDPAGVEGYGGRVVSAGGLGESGGGGLMGSSGGQGPHHHHHHGSGGGRYQGGAGTYDAAGNLIVEPGSGGSGYGGV